MTLDLSPEVLKTLPEPDAKGMVRVVVALQVGEGGEATVSEINDVPVTGADEKAPEPAADDTGMEPAPSADEIDKAVYSQQPPQ